jgi:GTPase SAR1 family protein
MKWYPELQNLAPNTLKIFVGNKIDLRSEYRNKNKNPKDAPIEK